MSSGLNSLAAVVWEDILKPMSWTQTMSEKHQVNVLFYFHLIMNTIYCPAHVVTADVGGIKAASE